MISCEYFKTVKSSFFYRTPLVAANVLFCIIFSKRRCWIYCSFTLHNCFILKSKITLIAFVCCTTRCCSLNHSLSFVVSRCHSLSFIVTRCHSLSLVAIRCNTRSHSLSWVVPLVVICCHSLSFVIFRCITRCHSMYYCSVFL